jgi:hypothetical protein
VLPVVVRLEWQDPDAIDKVLEPVLTGIARVAHND